MALKVTMLLALRCGAAFMATLALRAHAEPADRPWMNPALSPDARAALLQKRLTQEQKLGLLRILPGQPVPPPGGDPAALTSAGFVKGIAALGLPDLQITDGPLGPNGGRDEGRHATPMPATLATAATWNPEIARANGAAMGEEAWRKGFNVLLAGGVNLAREPRNGRNFEYSGEDPLLAGVMVGETIRGIQSRQVVSTVKHFAMNNQETQRVTLSAAIPEADMRESDLLAFQIAIERGSPGSVMCAYNRIGGQYACENELLLNRILKRDWAYPGWVMSDWGAVHSTVPAVMNGLDQQAPQQEHPDYFGEPLAAAIGSGAVPQARIDDMARRILRSLFAAGLFDRPPQRGPIDAAAGAAQAQRAAEESIVLLRNRERLLPLPPQGRIAVIGGHADFGVLSGGGSSQVRAAGDREIELPASGRFPKQNDEPIYHPSSPLEALRAAAPAATVAFDDGTDPDRAAAAARAADVAVLFVGQWNREVYDLPSLALMPEQDRLIEAVAAANPRTVVVLQSGNPVLMPWLGRTGAVLAAWYPGARGGPAIAAVLLGRANPSGRLPITFPQSEAQLPRPEIPGIRTVPDNPMAFGEPFDVPHPEGPNVGYRWFEAREEKPLFPFGFGLSYTSFRYTSLKVRGGRTLTVSFDVTNTGDRAGMDVPQAYVRVTGRDRRQLRRLIGWQKIALEPGQTRRVTLTADPRLLANFDERRGGWALRGGSYQVAVAASADDVRLTGRAALHGRRLPP